ncbi:cytochrome P450 [Russula brevipes]|nr:cytochrome P450 [Russula brevipes]
MFLPSLAGIRRSHPQVVIGPLAYPTPVAPFSATSTDDRACSVVCQRNAAFDITRIPLVPFDIFQMFSVPTLVSDTLRRSPVHRGRAANDTSRARVSSGPPRGGGRAKLCQQRSRILQFLQQGTLATSTPAPVGMRIWPPEFHSPAGPSVPRSGAVVSGVRIPGRTVVSQSPLFVSFMEEIFAQPHEFIPDWWLQPGSRSLENWLVAFSKGPRSCLGINLAHCELYLALVHIFRCFDVAEDLSR